MRIGSGLVVASAVVFGCSVAPKDMGEFCNTTGESFCSESTECPDASGIDVSGFNQCVTDFVFGCCGSTASCAREFAAKLDSDAWLDCIDGFHDGRVCDSWTSGVEFIVPAECLLL